MVQELTHQIERFSFPKITDKCVRLTANASKASGGSKVEDLMSPAPICLLSNESWTPQGEGVVLDSILDRVLSQLQPICLAEQAFCTKFLQLGSSMNLPIKVTSFEKTKIGNNLWKQIFQL